MTLKEFIKIAKDVMKWQTWQEEKDLFLKIEWTTGGLSGGSCYDTGDNTHYAVDAEIEPEFETLDALLEKTVPHLTMLQYKRLLREVVVPKTWTQNDYYGNHTNYAKKTVYLKDLYEWLEANNLLSSKAQ